MRYYLYQVLESKSPTPKYVAAEELRVLQACLQRWRTEVGADVKGNFSIVVLVPTAEPSSHLFQTMDWMV